METAIKSSGSLKNWITLARLPLHSVGIAPMLVGTVWANQYGIEINWLLAFFAILAVMMTIVTTHYAGEYFDQKEDILSHKYGKGGFAGGTGVLPKQLMPARPVFIGAQVAALITAGLGIFIYLYFNTGVWTIPLGALGLLSGYFYSTPPVRIVKRHGLGELFIGICYGWLPIFIANYLQSDILDTRLFLVAAPVAISIFLVIFMNEFPDYPADKEAGKTNLAVSIGLEKSAIVYTVFQLINIAVLYFIISEHIFKYDFWLLLPIVLCLVLSIAMILKLYKNKKLVDMMCAFTIIENLSISIIFIVSKW